jgi:hypothetical protein
MTQPGPTPGQSPQPWSGSGGDEGYQAPTDPWGEQPEAGWGGNAVSSPSDGGPQSGALGPYLSGHPVGGGLGHPEGGFGHLEGGLGHPEGGLLGHPESGPGRPEGYPPVSGAGPADVPPTWSPITPPGTPPARRGPGVPIVALVVVLGLLICGGLGVTGWLLTRPTDHRAGNEVAPTPSSARTTDSSKVVVPAPRASQDARFVAKGQCVRNVGTPAAPQMTIAACASGTYEVLARAEGRTTGKADAEAKCASVRGYTKWYFYDSELDSLDFVLCLRER